MRLVSRLASRSRVRKIRFLREIAFDPALKSRWDVIFPAHRKGTAWYQEVISGRIVIIAVFFLFIPGACATFQGAFLGSLLLFLAGIGLTSLGVAMAWHLETASSVFKKIFDPSARYAWSRSNHYREHGNNGWHHLLKDTREKLSPSMSIQNTDEIIRILEKQRDLGIPVLSCHTEWVSKLLDHEIRRISYVAGTRDGLTNKERQLDSIPLLDSQPALVAAHLKLQDATLQSMKMKSAV